MSRPQKTSDASKSSQLLQEKVDSTTEDEAGTGGAMADPADNSSDSQNLDIIDAISDNKTGSKLIGKKSAKEQIRSKLRTLEGYSGGSDGRRADGVGKAQRKRKAGDSEDSEDADAGGGASKKKKVDGGGERAEFTDSDEMSSKPYGKGKNGYKPMTPATTPTDSRDKQLLKLVEEVKKLKAEKTKLKQDIRILERRMKLVENQLHPSEADAQAHRKALSARVKREMKEDEEE